MYKHLFKLIWNKRRQNFLFLSEILVSFMVIFAVFSLMVYYYLNYRKPQGIAYQDIWNVSYSNPSKSSNTDSVNMFYNRLASTLKALPQVDEVCFTAGNYPYADSHSTTGFSYAGKSYSRINTYNVDDNYAQTLNMKVLEGRWFTKQDGLGRNNSMVINETLRKQLFGSSPAVGKLIGGEEIKDKSKVIGVVADVKAEGDYWPAGPGFYKRLDTGAFHWIGDMLLRVNKDADAAFESKLHKLLANNIKNSNLEIKHLSEMRDSKNQETAIPMMICIVIASFLIINVALGLFGVLWYNINQRRGEIGLRRAIGASGSAVAAQLVLESLFLATLSIIVGTFFAIQFPLLNVFDVPSAVYLIALLLSILFIYLLVILCSLYPGKQAASIHPAIALHEE
jgi:putative ABC transport system permease protein